MPATVTAKSCAVCSNTGTVWFESWLESLLLEHYEKDELGRACGVGLVQLRSGSSSERTCFKSC